MLIRFFRERAPRPNLGRSAAARCGHEPAGTRGGTSEKAMTKPETMMPFRRAAGSWLAAAACQISAIPPMMTLKKRAGLAQMAAKAVMPIITAEIHAAPQASREWGQANADTNSHVHNSKLA